MNGNFASRLFTGLVIISIGVLFLLRQTGYVDFDIGDAISVFWPVILIIVGIRGLLAGRLHGSGSGWWGAIVLLIGFIFLGRNLGWFEWSISDIIPYVWPVVVILIGINLIWRPKSRRNDPPEDDWTSYRPFDDQTPVPPAPPLHPDPTKTPINLKKGQENASADSSDRPYDFMNVPTAPEPPELPNYKKSYKEWKHEHKRRHKEWKCQHKEHVEWWNHSDPNVQTRSGFIGDIHIGHDFWDLKPLNVSHFIGDTVLDLTKAQVAPGETKICISSFIGDVKVFVPNDFEVGVQVVSSAFIGDVKVLGRKEGGMFNNIHIQSPLYTESDKKIKLIVSTFIGDVRVTKVG
ncbi:cell wall-active antibiotics response protein [Paenibacillus sp. N4]|uniref:cell wall-active antibiotics response protein LiaF n=1 Tax=Paenibacillus vietnamensis TaxID=2590547 RepID=UPI001CD14CFE|nr:cell wall-active antibiotics response protein LiaF [Paenibacillus vietnamensis]MCA0755488.1 cell wall-active antibiotics response protein [Paenibacillus vietnamensis]